MHIFRGPAKGKRDKLYEEVDDVELSKINGGWDEGVFRVKLDLAKDPRATRQSAGVVCITEEDVLFLCQSLIKEKIKDSYRLMGIRITSENGNTSPEEKLRDIKKLLK